MQKNIRILLFLAASTPAWATPSGLNNIPTADVVGHRTVAIQAFSSFGDGPNQFAANGPGQHSFWLGFKTGWELSGIKLEVGMDSPITPGLAGPLFFQSKIGMSPWEGGSIAVGVAGIALTDTDRAGDPFTYAMIAQDLHWFRIHAGYGLQNNGNSVLLGIDRTWKVFGNNFNLNADLVQTGDESGWLTALGVKYDVCKHVVLEGWMNLPDEGRSSFVAKINFVFQY